ncbi:MAG: sodium:solute symporter family protein [Moraxellaceae bacterium]
MLIWFVALYWLLTIGIGLWAATRVKNTADFAVAGRSLPLAVITTMVFATWFGSEAVLGIPATFLDEGIGGIVADPFGAALCLILVGLFFAVPLYRMRLITIGDYYRLRYGRAVEVMTSIGVVLSYLGWVAAQLMALGLVFNVVSDGAISAQTGMFMGAAAILIYTLTGGMWSVAVTDFVQMIVIVVGMIYIAFVLAGDVDGGATAVISHAAAQGKFSNFWPEMTPTALLAFIGAGITLMFGSIPQQDVFARVASAKNENVARTGAILGGILYFCFALIPIFLAYSATLINPELVTKWKSEDSQMILPQLILSNAGIVAQIMFFGALLSAIMSTASATLLAPSLTFSENILRDLIPRKLTDKENLLMMRAVVLGFAIFVTLFALNSNSSIYEMVENAYKVTLVACFVPLTAGLYWKRATNIGAIASIVLGVSTWVILEIVAPEGEGLCPPQLAGLVMAIIGMVVGSLLSEEHDDPLTHHDAHRHGERLREFREARK